VWGFVHNLKNNKSTGDEKFDKDHQILGATALAWNMFKAHSPKEVIEALEEDIKQAGVPEMSAEGHEGEIQLFDTKFISNLL